jgi:hypothetical protein
VLLVPISRHDGSPVGVVQVARPDDLQFLDDDVQAAEYVVSKFRTYSPYIFAEDELAKLAFSLTKSSQQQTAFAGVISLLSAFFRCRQLEIWRSAPDGSLLRSTAESPSLEPWAGAPGIAGASLADEVIFNEKLVKNNAAFAPAVDGGGDEPGLFVPCESWAFALRGRDAPPYFSKTDECHMAALAPFAAKALQAAVAGVSQGFVNLEQRLAVLLEVAEALAGVLDIDILIPMILGRAARSVRLSAASLSISICCHAF